MTCKPSDHRAEAPKYIQRRAYIRARIDGVQRQVEYGYICEGCGQLVNYGDDLRALQRQGIIQVPEA